MRLLLRKSVEGRTHLSREPSILYISIDRPLLCICAFQFGIASSYFLAVCWYGKDNELPVLKESGDRKAYGGAFFYTQIHCT